MKNRTQKRLELGQESLSRAQGALMGSGQDKFIRAEFRLRGIDATPRVDVFTYNGWFALGRQVRKGEKSVKGTTWIPIAGKTPADKGRVIPKGYAVFHVSQTDAIPGREGEYNPDAIASRREEAEAFAVSMGAELVA
jgi:hypothetical protein